MEFDEELVKQLTDEILKLLDDRQNRVAISALMAALEDILSSFAPNLPAALSILALACSTAAENLVSFDNQGLCGWNEGNALQ